MTRCLMATLVITLTVVLSGCGPAERVMAKAKVSGTVELDGQPMDEPEGEISFQPGGGHAPVVMPIKAGKFEGEGPVGECRVEVRAWRTGKPIMMDGKPFGDPVRENYIPASFNSASKLTAQVEASGTTGLKFEVKSK